MLVLLSVAGPASAQAVHGAIVGSVMDTTGAVVPGATVILTDTDKGVVRTTISSAVGAYQFLDADADHYNLEVEAHGFEKWTTTGLQLSTLQTLRVDAKLVIGSASTTVNVAGENTGVIQTETPTITTTFNSDDVVNLPTNFRASSSGTSILATMSAMPGVQADQGSYSVEGNLPFMSDMTVDGITNIRVGSSGNPVLFPSADDVASIQLTGVLAPAEFGDPAQVSVTTRGGTNALHGAAWEYHQNSGMNANTFGSLTRPHMVANTYGGKLGGPVVIPHVYDGRNKSFFFVDYEGFRLPESVAMQATVPTKAMKNGDFTDYSNPSSTFTGLTDPYEANTNWGNTIPAGNLSSIAQQFLQFYPDPNTPATLTGGGTVPTTSYVNGESPNYYSNVSQPTHSDQIDVRGDQYFGSNQKLLLWGRYTYYNTPSVSGYNLNFDSSTNVYDSSNLTTSLSWTIKPDLINVGLFGFTRWRNGDANPYNGVGFTQGLGLTALNDLWYNGFPYISFSNITSPPAGRLNSIDTDNTYSYSDSLSWTKGKHSFKFGADVRSYTYIGGTGITTGDNYGNFYFNNGNGTGTFTGVDFADFLLGVPDTSSYDDITRDIDGTTAEYHVYAEDHWRVTPKLSIDYGVRYEYRPAFYDKNGYYANMDYDVPLTAEVVYPTFPQPNLQSASTLASSNACDPDGVNNTNNATVNGAPCMPVVSNTAAGLPRGLRYIDKSRILPRLGFAYRLTNDGKWVVRSGFGLYNVTIMGQTFHSLTGTIQGSSSAYTNAIATTDGQQGPLYTWPQIGYGSGTSGCTTCYGTNEFNASIDIHYHDAETAQWALTVEHDLGHGYGVRASYTGSGTSHLNLKQDQNTLPLSSTISAYNQPLSARRFPNWGVLMNYGSQANANYNALEIEAKHRMEHGLQFDSTFTWARALSDNTGASDTQFSGERGGGDFGTWVYDKKLDYGNSPGTRRLHWLTTSIYELPIGRGRQFGATMPRALDAVIGGWQLSNIFTWQTGAYLTPTFSDGQGDPSGTGSGLSQTAAGWGPPDANQHPDRVAGVSWKPAHQGRNGWINGNAFACPGWSAWVPGETCDTGAGYNADGTPRSANGPALPIGRFGNSGIGTVQGPGFVQLNSGLAKVFALTERFKLRIEASYTNVTNHTNLNANTLNLNLGDNSFGVITGGIGGRSAQIAARLDF